MLKSYRFRLNPSLSQEVQLKHTFGAARFVYNWGLEQKIKHYTETGGALNCIDLINMLPALKESETWLKDTNAQALQMALRNLDNAFTGFFKEKKGFPKFKSRREPTQSCQYPQGVKIDFDKRVLFIPKIKDTKIKIDRRFEGKIKTVTISKTPTGKYYASILVDDGKELPIKQTLNKETAVGLDLGLKHFLIDSNGKKIDNPQFLRKSEEKLKQKSRQLSRKQIGSNNRDKARKKLALLHEKVVNQRQDFLHKLSTQIVHENQGGICIEDLNVAGMVRNHRLAKSINDASWGEFVRQLKYKTDWYGKNLLTIGRFEPSSKTCSTCGTINKSLELKTREWTCEVCQTTHDRDINAAINIKNMAFHPQNLVGV